MKTIKLFILLIAATFFLTPAMVLAVPVNFGDSAHNWDNWAVQSGDTNGTPDILGGTANFDLVGNLTSLSFDVYSNTYITGFRNLKAGDLFFDVGSDQDWDYVVDSYLHDASKENGTDNVYTIYSSVNKPLGTYDSSDPNVSYYEQAVPANHRTHHPVAYIAELDEEVSNTTATLTGWWANDTSTVLGTTYTVTYAFSGNGLYIGPNEDFIIGWGVDCANDVIYEGFVTTNEVPEPATMFLLGSGLIGLAGVGRRKFIKS